MRFKREFCIGIGLFCLNLPLFGVNDACNPPMAKLAPPEFNPLATLHIYSNLLRALRLGSVRKVWTLVRGIGQLHEIIEPEGRVDRRELELAVHTSKIAEIMKQPEFDFKMEQFRLRLEATSQSLFDKKELPPKNLWQIALEVNNGDKEATIDFLMIFIQDSVASYSGISDLLEKKGVKDAANKWLQVQTLRFAIGALSDETQKLNPNHFYSTPDSTGPAIEYNQFYHFWSAAYIAKELKNRGVSPDMAKYLGLLNGDAYERATFLLIKLSGNKMATEPDSKPGGNKIEHPINHIAAHIRGAIFGVDQDEKTLPSQEETVEFVRKNFWSHYRAIAYGDFGKGKPVTDAVIIKALKELDREKLALIMMGLAITYHFGPEYCECIHRGDQYYLELKSLLTKTKKVLHKIRITHESKKAAAEDACLQAMVAQAECQLTHRTVR